MRTRFLIALVLSFALLGILLSPLLFPFPGTANAQGPTPSPVPTPIPTPPTGQVKRVEENTGDIILVILRLTLDTLQGRATPGLDALFEQSRQSATSLLNPNSPDIFFLDFGNPDLSLNQFALQVAQNLLSLTPLYVFGYLVLLVLNVWKERPIPNPLLYGALVIAVMVFLAAFAVITQGVGEVGRALAVALGGTGNALFPRGALLDTVARILLVLQKNGGILAPVTLLVAIIETLIIMIQLAYRGLSMAIWRLLGVLLIPLSVLVEGINPKTAGKVLSGFFEAWLDMVGKIALLLITLSIASAKNFEQTVWFVLPAGLLLVTLSWKFFGLFYTLIRDAFARAWSGLVPVADEQTPTSLPAAAEAARAKEIDAERKRLMED